MPNMPTDQSTHGKKISMTRPYFSSRIRIGTEQFCHDIPGRRERANTFGSLKIRILFITVVSISELIVQNLKASKSTVPPPHVIGDNQF